MELLARLLINVEGDGTSYIHYNSTESYYKKLRAAYIDIENNKSSEYLFFGFFTLCAATLEFSLNFLLTDHCIDRFGVDHYRAYAESYLRIDVRNRLTMCPGICSDGKVVMNEESSAYKNLLEMISLRNKIIHGKEFLEAVEMPKFKEANASKEEINFSIPIKANHIDTLTKEMCLKFGKSLGSFKKYIMEPILAKDLQSNEMIIINSWQSK